MVGIESRFRVRYTLCTCHNKRGALEVAQVDLDVLEQGRLKRGDSLCRVRCAHERRGRYVRGRLGAAAVEWSAGSGRRSQRRECHCALPSARTVSRQACHLQQPQACGARACARRPQSPRDGRPRGSGAGCARSRAPAGHARPRRCRRLRSAPPQAQTHQGAQRALHRVWRPPHCRAGGRLARAPAGAVRARLRARRRYAPRRHRRRQARRASASSRGFARRVPVRTHELNATEKVREEENLSHRLRAQLCELRSFGVQRAPARQPCLVVLATPLPRVELALRVKCVSSRTYGTAERTSVMGAFEMRSMGHGLTADPCLSSSVW
jgi:hypothetical protein